MRAMIWLLCAGWLGWESTAVAADAPPRADRPNVIMILTDDQGYGDLGVHGNTVVRTPHLDRLAGESVALDRFHVCPVCAPTRASLLTGRYHLRTGAIDTYLGRALIDPDEITLAEVLRGAGYRTGLFGKWHLGDDFPRRPIDQGFEQAVWHRGGGIGQAADPPGNSYFNPVLHENGGERKYEGYCSDIFTTAAIDFVEQYRREPFFAYLAFNCPHTPLEVADELVEPYRQADFPEVEARNAKGARRLAPDRETTARIYAMVSNIDDNVGRLLKRLDELQLAENTIVVFLTDNGPQQPRYNAGMRDLKGTVFDGGIRVPCYLRWTGHWEAGRRIDYPTAHIDLLPTLLAACGVAPPQVALDGQNLLDLLAGKAGSGPERLLFFQWHRGDVPEHGRACAVRDARYKLAQPIGQQEKYAPDDARWILFDLSDDPGEKRDRAAELPAEVARLRQAYDAWFADVTSTRGFAPQRIFLGAPEQPQVTLTRQDWRGPAAGWTPRSVGHWEVQVVRAGDYRLTVRLAPLADIGELKLSIQDRQFTAQVPAKSDSIVFERVALVPGAARLEAAIAHPQGVAGATYVDVEPAN